MAIALEYLMDIYRQLKDHVNEIMPKRPEGHPSAAWRMSNPAPVRAAFRIYEGSKQRIGWINYDTSPFFEVRSDGAKPKLIERIDLRANDAEEKLAAYALPAEGDMAGWEMAAIRKLLGLTQPQLATILDYAHYNAISAMETGGRKVPTHIARLMKAYERGDRPSDWPV
jgi:DNA-binding transcriptional regulator YiaG